MASNVSFKLIPGVIIAIVAVVFGNIYAATSVDKDKRATFFRFEFICILETLIFLGARYIWRNVTTALSLPSGGSRADRAGSRPSWQTVILGATMLYLIIVLLSYLTSVFAVGVEPSLLGMSCFIALGSFIQLNFCIFLMNRVLWLCSFFQSRPTSKQQKASYSVCISMIYALSICTYGVHFASQPPVIKHVEIPVKKLPSVMDGFKVVIVSDVHLGATVGKYKLNRIVEMVNQLDADIVAMVGDFVDARVSKLAGAAEPIKNLRSKKGNYFVTGNHEYFSGGVDDWFDYWRSHGVNILHNQHTKIHSNKDPLAFFCLAGVDDTEANKIMYDGHGMDLDKAVSGCEEGHAIVLLAHRPQAAKVALDSKYDIQLVLSGHTHGGQMFPVMVGAYIFNPFYAGLYAYGGGHVYVSQGAVYWGIPIRVGTQHELSLITLRAVQ